jgi:hypothetical protein
MPRDYIGHGVRAAGTLELCPENDLERIQKLLNEVDHERFTRLDRGLLAKAKDNIVVVMTADEQDPARQTMRVGRLKTLERLGLAPLNGNLELRIRHSGFSALGCATSTDAADAAAGRLDVKPARIFDSTRYVRLIASWRPTRPVARLSSFTDDRRQLGAV